MPDVLFYHLERQSLEAVLPTLLEKTLERGWRAVVQAGSVERVEALNQLLWTYRDDSFLPHGAAGDGHAPMQPVYLTDDTDRPNEPAVRFLVDGADIETADGYVRVVYLFAGQAHETLQRVRAAWTRFKSQGANLSYWQQSEDGRWQKRA